MKTLALTLVLIVLSSFRMGDSSAFEWQPTNPLTWDVYKAPPSATKEFAASSATEIRFDPIVKSDGKIYFLVRAMFHPESSYAQISTINGAQSSYILNHEQRHFDITELYCRIIRKKLKSLQGCTDHAKYSLAIFLYHHISVEWGEYQDKYDKETENSQNCIMQKSWDNRIDSQLLKLNDWKLDTNSDIYKLKMQLK